MSTLTLHAHGTETASGVGPSVPMSDNSIVGMFTNISDVSGTLPTLTVKLQQTPNGNDWYDIPNFFTSALSSVALSDILSGTTVQKVADNVRCVWTIGGVNPSYTFTVEIVVVP